MSCRYINDDRVSVSLSVGEYVYIYTCVCVVIEYLQRLCGPGHRVTREVRFGMYEVVCVCDGGVRAWHTNRGKAHILREQHGPHVEGMGSHSEQTTNHPHAEGFVPAPSVPKSFRHAPATVAPP